MSSHCTLQDLPEWLPDAKKQQVLNMLFPAAWLHQDPDFQPQWKLPLGWEPPECAGDGLRPHAEPLDSALQEGLQQVSHLQVRQMLWSGIFTAGLFVHCCTFRLKCYPLIFTEQEVTAYSTAAA